MTELSLMGKDWDERARKNAFYYICTDHRDWDPDAFFQSGEADYQHFVAPVLAQFEFDPRGKSMLEVGCGAGRMTRTFAKHFARVHALDVSQEMLRRAKELNADYPNVVWLPSDGRGFSPLSTESLDFVFSYLVLQHVPTKELALGYLHEVFRVLKPGGLFCFQFNSRPKQRMNWKGRMAWRLIDRLREPILGLRLERIGQGLTSLAGWDFLEAGRTWRGASLAVREVLEIVWELGGTVSAVTGWDTRLTWCCGQIPIVSKPRP